MEQPADTYRRMSVAEFLDWNPEGDTRYELVRGAPLAMAPPHPAHSTIAFTLASLIGDRLRGKPGCAGRSEAGLRSALHDDSYFQADLAVFCRSAADPTVFEPTIVIEVLSASTEDHDRKTKLPDYRSMGSVREIVLIDSTRSYCEIHRRTPEGRWLTDLLLLPEAVLRLETIGLSAALSEVYAEVEFPTQADAKRAPGATP
jgi:Uma2 family endonuclease